MGKLTVPPLAIRVNTCINLIILLMTFIVLLGGAELVLRLLFRDVTTTADNRSYFAKRWREQAASQQNVWGFRERGFDLSKPEGNYRIAVIGDSLTYGQGIEETERFTNLLEKEFNRKNAGYEVLNFGRPGANTVDHLDILNTVVLKIHPNFILLQWYTNDVEGRDKNKSPHPRSLVPLSLRLNSALFYFLNKQLVNLQYKLNNYLSYDEYMVARFGDPNSTESVTANKALQEFINICREEGVSMGIVIFSDSYFHASPLDFLTERVLEICQQEGIACLDLRDTFAPYKEDPKLWANRLDQHPSAFANRLVAQRLMNAFGEGWLNRAGEGIQ